MVHIWLARNHGRVRLYLQNQWHVADNWQDVNGLLKQANVSNSSVCLYLPSVNVFQTQKQINKVQLKQLGDEGLGYLIEDDVLANPDSLYIKYVKTSEELINIVAINKNFIETLKQSLELVDLQLKVVLPDFLLVNHIHDELDSDEKTVCIYADSETTLIRTEENLGIYAEDIELAVSRLPEYQNVIIYGSQQDKVRQSLNHLFESNKRQLLSDSELEVSPIVHPEKHALNLMPKSKGLGVSPYMRVIGMLVCVGLLCVLVFDLVRISKYKKLESNYQSQMYGQYKKWFPNERPPADIIKTLQSKTHSDSNTSTKIFSAFSNASALIQQNGLQIESLELNQETVNLQVLAKSTDEIQNLVNQMNAQGMKATLGSVNSADTQMKGEVTVLP